MINRYLERSKKNTEKEAYPKVFEGRNIENILHYTTAQLNYPSEEQLKNILAIRHIWKTGDKFYKLSYKYYNDVQDWWVIAQFNKKPTESHVQIGEELLIPVPIHEAIKYLRG